MQILHCLWEKRGRNTSNIEIEFEKSFSKARFQETGYSSVSCKEGKKRVFVQEKFGANLEECLVGRNDDSSCERFQTWEGNFNLVVLQCCRGAVYRSENRDDSGYE